MILFHNSLIKAHNSHLFDTLLYKHHLSTQTPKVIEFEDMMATEGFFMIKNNVKYVLDMVNAKDEKMLDKLPIRVVQSEKRNTKDNNVVQHIIRPSSFKITPDLKYSVDKIFQMDGIIHENVETWIMIKVITFTAYCKRINIVLSGLRHCGKTSYPSSLGQITNKGHVIDKPGSVAGLVKGVTEDGYLALDEIGSLASEERRTLYNFLFQSGGMNNYFITGKAGSKAHNLLSKYDIHNLSVMILCNLYEDYLFDGKHIDMTKKKAFFHYMFDNNQAVHRRFIPLRINPCDCPIKESDRQKLKEYLPAKQFKDSMEYDDNIKKQFININKSLEYYRINWNKLVDYDFIDQFIEDDNFHISNNHLLYYREMLGGIYIFCKALGDKDLFHHWASVLQTWNRNFYAALDKYNNQDTSQDKLFYEEEVVK